MHLIYITFPNQNAAIKIANMLVKGKFMACANIYNNVTSIYEWQGEIKQNQEVTLIGKAADNNVEKIIEIVTNEHEYDCPCVLAIKVTKGSKKFLKWVETCNNVDY